MKETKYARGKPGSEKRKSTRVNHLASASTLYNTCIKINNSCIKIIKSKNIKQNAPFSYACVIRCVQFLMIKFFNTHRSFYSSRKTIRQI